MLGRTAGSGVSRALGEQCRAVPRALAAAHHELPAVEVDVLHPEGEALVEAKAGAIEQLRNEAEGGLEVVEQAEHVTGREHRREVVRAAGSNEVVQRRDGQVEDPPVKEDDRTECLVVGGGGEVALGGEMIEKSSDLGAAERSGVAAAVEGEEGPDPVGVGFLGAGREVKAPEGGVDEPRRGSSPFIDASEREVACNPTRTKVSWRGMCPVRARWLRLEECDWGGTACANRGSASLTRTNGLRKPGGRRLSSVRPG